MVDCFCLYGVWLAVYFKMLDKHIAVVVSLHFAVWMSNNSVSNKCAFLSALIKIIIIFAHDLLNNY